MAEMIAEVDHALRRAGVEDDRALVAAAAVFLPLEARLADLAFRLERLEQAVVARWEQAEFRLDEVESGLTEIARPSWPF